MIETVEQAAAGDAIVDEFGVGCIVGQTCRSDSGGGGSCDGLEACARLTASQFDQLGHRSTCQEPLLVAQLSLGHRSPAPNHVAGRYHSCCCSVGVDLHRGRGGGGGGGGGGIVERHCCSSQFEMYMLLTGVRLWHSLQALHGRMPDLRSAAITMRYTEKRSEGGTM